MSAHTPGPWTLAQYGASHRWAIMHDGHILADVDCELASGEDDHYDARQANARLIAAAPELLAVCQEVEMVAGNYHLVEIARAAIAKATGTKGDKA